MQSTLTFFVKDICKDRALVGVYFWDKSKKTQMNGVKIMNIIIIMILLITWGILSLKNGSMFYIDGGL